MPITHTLPRHGTSPQGAILYNRDDRDSIRDWRASERFDGEDIDVPIMGETIFDGEPLRPLTDKDVRRRVIFACVYYAVLATIVLTAFAFR